MHVQRLIKLICLQAGVPADRFAPVKELSKFLIVMAMAAIGLNSNLVKLIKTGGKPILLGACCWLGITLISLFHAAYVESLVKCGYNNGIKNAKMVQSSCKCNGSGMNM